MLFLLLPHQLAHKFWKWKSFLRPSENRYLVFLLGLNRNETETQHFYSWIVLRVVSWKQALSCWNCPETTKELLIYITNSFTKLFFFEWQYLYDSKEGCSEVEHVLCSFNKLKSFINRHVRSHSRFGKKKRLGDGYAVLHVAFSRLLSLSSSHTLWIRQGNKAWTVTLGEDKRWPKQRLGNKYKTELETMRHRTQAEPTTGKKKGKQNMHRSNSENLERILLKMTKRMLWKQVHFVR